MDNDEVFTIRARRCLKCGRLLTSKQAIIDGYGSCCLQRVKQAAVEREAAKNQYSLFPIEEGDQE